MFYKSVQFLKRRRSNGCTVSITNWQSFQQFSTPPVGCYENFQHISTYLYILIPARPDRHLQVVLGTSTGVFSTCLSLPFIQESNYSFRPQHNFAPAPEDCVRKTICLRMTKWFCNFPRCLWTAIFALLCDELHVCNLERLSGELSDLCDDCERADKRRSTY